MPGFLIPFCCLIGDNLFQDVTIRPIFPSPISVTPVAVVNFPFFFDDFLPMEPMEPMEGFRNRPTSAKIASP
jgi:hypothetical protein